ncbi:hypothetical protein ACN47E_004769 [Coniothyrium glycines]
MDTDMMDAAYDIDIDVGAEPIPIAHQPQQVIEQNIAAKDSIPEAYLEDIMIEQPWPESLNLQGVGNFDPNDPLYYAMEHCGAEPRVKQLRWVNDSSVNLEFYTAQDAAVALGILTHPEVSNPGSMSKQESRKAKPYSKKPDSILMVRESNAGDQKPKGAATRSKYYKQNPDVAGNRQREPRRRRSPPPRRDFLDYGDEDAGARQRSRRRSSGDESMNGDSGADRRRPRRDGRDTRDNRGRESRGRDGRLGRDSDAGRLNKDIDSYRPGERSPQESRFGRLRGRSASPASDEEGDGRYGFAEEATHAGRRRYRSRSRSRDVRRKREPSGERWTHDRANHDRTPGGRWQKDSAMLDSSPMGNHRRSDAMDVTKMRSGASLLSRMTKDGQPMVPQQKRSLADRITRDDDGDDSFGRLNNNDRDPWVSDFSESKPRRRLADRISRNDDINIRGRSQEGINIRGSASANGATEGINIRGVANGA